MVFIRCLAIKNLKMLHYEEKELNAYKLVRDLCVKTELPAHFFSLYCNGKLLYLNDKIPHNACIDVCFRVLGGKGGFGSMLRAIGAQIEKTTNREACRDLSGRRLRDINEEQRLKRWLAKKAEREAEQLKRRKARLERLKEQPKHEFHDPEYNKERSELPERIDDALSQGLKKSSILSRKHKKEETEPLSKKRKTWLDDDIPSDLDEADSDIEELDDDADSQMNSPDLLDDCHPSSSSSQDTNDASTSNAGSSSNKDCGKNQQHKSPETELEKDSTNQLKTTKLGNSSSSKQTHVSKIDIDNLGDSDNCSLTTVKDQVEKKNDVVDLLQFKTCKELENLGLDKLKTMLITMGLKCGGTLSERASRLWSVRGLDSKDYPNFIKAKPNKK